MTRLFISGTSFMPSFAAVKLMEEIHQMIIEIGDCCPLTPTGVAERIQDKIKTMEASTRVRTGKIWLKSSFSYNAFSDSVIWIMYGPSSVLAFIRISPFERKEPEFEKIDVFIGPAQSRKTVTALKLCRGITPLFIHGRTASNKLLKTILSTVLPDLELIIFDDLPLSKLKTEIYTLSNMILEIPSNESQYLVKRPKIIITCDCSLDRLPTDESFKRRTNVRVFPQQDDRLDF